MHQYCREKQEAQIQTEEGIALATEQGFSLWVADFGVHKGIVLIEQGQRAEGFALIRESIAAVRTTGAEIGCPRYLMLLAEAYEKSGQIEEGLATLAEASDIINRTQECLWEAELYRLKGELLLLQNEERRPLHPPHPRAGFLEEQKQNP
jgi:predicted ATPase